MNKTGSKRQKTSGPDTPKEVVTLNMDTDEVPLKTSEMTHEFMTDITTLEDTQLADSVPKTLTLVWAQLRIVVGSSDRKINAPTRLLGTQ